MRKKVEIMLLKYHKIIGWILISIADIPPIGLGILLYGLDIRIGVISLITYQFCIVIGIALAFPEATKIKDKEMKNNEF